MFVVLNASCGGGGGGSDTPVDQNKTIDLSKFQTTSVGTIYTSQLTGSDSEGGTYSGAFSSANRNQEMIEGVLVTPNDLLISLSGEGAPVTITGTSYIDNDGNLISITIQTTGVTCTPVTPDKIPDSVMINDFGIFSALNSSDNTVQERSCRIEDAGSGNIDIVASSTIKDEFNVVISVTDVTYTLNGAGEIVAFKAISTLSETGFTLSYQSV